MIKQVQTKVHGLLLMSIFSLLSFFGMAQTVLVDPTQGGGFELGATPAANGWSVVNASTDAWVVGNAPTAPTGTGCGYVSNDGGTSWSYSQTNTFVHMYRDITIPAGESKVVVSFKWKAGGEGAATSDWDNMKIWVAPSTFTPSASSQITVAQANLVNGPGSINGMYKLNSAWTQENASFAAVPGQTYRVIFSWKSDGSTIAPPSIALDDIGISSMVPGNFISIVSGNWTNPSTWQANAVPGPADNALVSTGHTVLLSSQNAGINNLEISGTLGFPTTTTITTFNVNGILDVNTGGVFNVFNGTSGKNLFVKGDIINDGVIHTSVGFTYLRLNGSTPQTVSGTGNFGTANASNMANSAYYLYFENTSTTYPNVIWNINNFAAQLIYFSGTGYNSRVELNGNTLISGDVVGTTFTAGTIIAAAGTGILPGGTFSRIWNTTGTGSAITANSIPTTTSQYPFCTLTGDNRSFWIQRVSATGTASATGSTAGQLAVTHTNGIGVTSGLNLTDVAYVVNNRSNAFWSVSDRGTGCTAPFYTTCASAGGVYTSIPLNMNARFMTATGFVGDHRNGGALPQPFAQRQVIPGASLLNTDFHVGFNDADYTPFAPGTITQSAGTPSCATGTVLTAAGAPLPNTAWFWQTSATGQDTSATAAYSVPNTFFANGTYFLRTYRTTADSLNQAGVWSPAVSYTISNMPVATAPPVPTASANPACAPAGANLSMPAAPAGTAYFWQNTTANGSSTALPATAIYNAPTSGTYQVAAYDSATTCWSATTPLAVVVDVVIPFDPTANSSYVNACIGATSVQVGASAITQIPGTLQAAPTSNNSCTGGAMFNITTNGMPVVINSFDMRTTASTGGTVNVYYRTGTYLGSETNAGAWTLHGSFPFGAAVGGLVTANVTPLNLAPNTTYGIYLNYSASYFNITAPTTYSDANMTITAGAGLCANFGSVIANRAFSGNVHYVAGAPTTTVWYPSATSTTPLGSGSPFETVGTSLLPNTATAGSQMFYVGSQAGGCFSVNRDSVKVNIAPVHVDIDSINATCNGNNNGSFSLNTSFCGTAPFTYSVNGGPFGPIPTNLTDGSYTVIVQDATAAQSAPYIVVVNEPAAPQNLATVDVNYFTAAVSWVPQGNETSWTVIYGPAGFTPGDAATMVINNATDADSTVLTGLSANSVYDFYVVANCGTNSDTSAVATFNTNPGFLAWDNTCGPGFIDISSTGTQIQGITDDSEFGLTLPWPWLVNGTTVNTVTIGNNGGVLFNTLTGNVGYTATGNGMFPYVEDLGTITNGGIYYQSLGTAPNRMFVIQWQNIPYFASPNPADGATFEIVVMEATNEVYYLYGDLTMGNVSDDNGADAEVALITQNGSAFVSMNSTAYFANNSCIHFYGALCPNVTNFTAVVDQTTATLDWNPGLYGETAWTVVYGPAGFDPTDPTQAIGTNNLVASDDLLSGLTQLTSYDVYIYSECAADNITSEGFFYNFMTLPYCAYPTNITATVGVDTLMVDWDWTAVDTTLYPSVDFNVSHVMIGNNVYAGTENSTGSSNEDLIVGDPNLLAGGVYQIYVQAVCLSGDTSGYAGPFTVVMPLQNDTVCGAEMLNLNTTYTFNNTGATVSLDEINIAPPATGAQTTDGWINSTLNNTLWFKFTAPASGQVRINSTSTNYNGQSAVYEVALCSDFNNNFDLVAANDNEIGGPSLAPNYTVCGLTPGNTYYIMHDGATGTGGNFGIRITEITLYAGLSNPVSDVCYGDTINLYTTINSYATGGAWTAPLASSNASIFSDSLFTTEGLAYQVFDFEYRIVDGCAFDTIVSQVKIFAPSNAGQDGTITACKNEPVDLLSGLTVNADFGGNWFDPSNNAIASSQVTTGNFPGSYNYDYVVGNGVCPDDTANVVINVGTCDWLDITEETFAGVEVFPNPTNGVVFVAASLNAGNFSYEVTDANGRVIAEAINGVTAAATTSIDLSKVETGVYFIQLSNATAKKVYRIVVQ
jgi:hypothetical protein